MDFDEVDGVVALPIVVNSKQKFDYGPTNNNRVAAAVLVNKKAAFGFVKPDIVSHEDEADLNLNKQIFKKNTHFADPIIEQKVVGGVL